MTQRTMESLQVQYLARKFDLSKESRVSRLILQEINEAMDTEDQRVSIERVVPFDLPVKLHRQYIRLPLFCEE